MNEVNNFENAKVGDRVYCLLNGEGEISSVRPNYIGCRFECGATHYGKDGKMDINNINPSLFRTPPTVTAPEPKKRVVKNTFWVVWYKHVREENIYGASFDGEMGYARFCASLKKDVYEVLKTETIEREFEI